MKKLKGNKIMMAAGVMVMCAVTACSSGAPAAATTAAQTTVAETTTEAEETSTEAAEETTEATAEADLQDELLAEYKREKYMRECESVGYRDLMRYEDEHKGKKLYLVGQIVQTMDGGFRCISESDEEYYVNDIREYDTTKVLVDDTVVIWGDYAGVTKLTRAVTNVEEEVPVIDAQYIDIYDESLTMEDYILEQGGATAESTAAETQNNITYETMYVVNCNESITLRTSPSTKASEIRQIPLGAAVSYIEGAENGFYKVSYLGNTGYALASYLSYQAPSNFSYATMRVVNCNESITLRTSPSTGASEIRQIPLGEVVSYIEPAANGFYKISYLGKTGYALASYLEFE